MQNELDFKKLMNKLHEACEEYKLYVPYLTKFNGNCMFESLQYHGIISTDYKHRHGLAFILYIFKHYKNFIPGDERTLAEQYHDTTYDPPKYVSSKNRLMKKGEIQFYKYSYDVMCQDLSNNGSWDKLRTNMILLILSRLYKLKIHILNITHNGSFLNTLNAFENLQHQPKLKTIYLANINEMHYLPLDIKK